MDFLRGKPGRGSASAGAQRSRRCREAARAQFRVPRRVSKAELLAHAAAVALHHAAPVEAAQAVLLEKHALAVPAAAAQQVAAAEVRGAAVGAAAGARRTRAPVGGGSRASRRHRAGQRGPAALSVRTAGSRALPSLVPMTREAPWNRSSSRAPTLAERGQLASRCAAHEPDRPWHLHSVRGSAPPARSIRAGGWEQIREVGRRKAQRTDRK